ncbi:MAG: hypothetical protein Q8L34_01360 [Candidatus Woesearchaeota archaeon]|nr:hypothetical protein [Candidatus Woesearchaeota archaeon]
MILTEEQLPQYLGKDLESKLSQFVSKTKAALRELDEITRDTVCQSFLDYVLIQHQREGRSITEIAQECNLPLMTFLRVLDRYDIPTRSKKEGIKIKWQDLEFKSKRVEASRKLLDRLKQDPIFRAKSAEATRKMLRQKWKDPEFRATNAKGVIIMLAERWKDPEFRARNAEMLSARNQKPKFREASRKLLDRLKQDPIFRAKSAEATRTTWQDLEFRAKIVEAQRNARLDPDRAGRYHLYSFQGVRKDVGYAKSTWEANLMRIFTFLGREYITHEKVPLQVSEKYRQLFKNINTYCEIDFVVTDPRRNIHIYEIMNFTKGVQGKAKLEMLAEQSLGVKVRLITPRFYNRLKKRFKEHINQDPKFAGWEDKEDNIRNNPSKYEFKNTPSP